MRYLSPTIRWLPMSIFLLLGCDASKKAEQIAKESDECAQYSLFIKNEWVQTGEGWFKFRDNEKIYEQYDKGNMRYPHGSCLAGATKEFIRARYGKPSREIVVRSRGINSFVYCLGIECIESTNFVGTTHAALLFKFDENDVVKEAMGGAYREHYRTLDR